MTLAATMLCYLGSAIVRRFIRYVGNNLQRTGTCSNILSCKVIEDILGKPKAKQVGLNICNPGVFVCIKFSPFHGITAAEGVAANAANQQYCHK